MILSLGEVSLEKNRAVFVLHASYEMHCGVPLLDVLDVWEPHDGKWEIKLRGTLRRVEGDQFDTLQYSPR